MLNSAARSTYGQNSQQRLLAKPRYLQGALQDRLLQSGAKDKLRLNAKVKENIASRQPSRASPNRGPVIRKKVDVGEVLRENKKLVNNPVEAVQYSRVDQPEFVNHPDCRFT